MGKALEIVFRPNEIDTEKVRETIEDHMGVEILEINDFNYPSEKPKSACELLDAMIEDERKAPGEYQKLSDALNNSELLYPPRENDLVKDLMGEHISDEQKHHTALVKLKQMVC